VIRFCSTNLSQECTADNQCGTDGICAAHFRFCTNDPTVDCTSDAQCGGGTCQSARCDVPKTIPGAIVSTSHDASYVTCSTCHADFGGQDGRTWDFSQFGASLRNTMDLRGRAGFAPGTCSNNPSLECFFDAACDDGDPTPDYCKANPAMIPPSRTSSIRSASCKGRVTATRPRTSPPAWGRSSSGARSPRRTRQT
jgi:hypothetical protein